MRLPPLLILLAACAPMPPATPPLPSTPPPPPPAREVAAAPVSGRVISAQGFPVIRTWVIAKAADAACRPTGFEVGAVTDDNGQYFALVETNSVTTQWGCVIVEARSGGTSGRASAPAFFDRPSMERRPVQVDVRLDPAPPLTSAEAERLVRLLAEEINNHASQGSPELAMYLEYGSEALRVALEQYRTLLRRVTHVRPAGGEDVGPRRRTFELRNAEGRITRIDVYEERIVRLHSPLIDYGLRAEAFMNAYLRFISSGDAERLARLLNPDDIDFPVERAREIIVEYRRRYPDTATIRASFAGLDERRHIIAFHLRGGEVTETIELVYGDGLLGVRGL